MGLNAKDDGSKFRHDQAERLRDHDVPPELRDETPDEKAARVRRDLAEGRTGWGEEGASWGGWRAQARGETEFWGYGDRPGIGMSDEEKFHFDLAGAASTSRPPPPHSPRWGPGPGDHRRSTTPERHLATLTPGDDRLPRLRRPTGRALRRRGRGAAGAGSHHRL